MVKLMEQIHQENISFSFLVGGLPTYNSKNLEMFMNIIHIIDTFHQQMCSIYALHKRFKCFGLNDILITAGIVVQGQLTKLWAAGTIFIFKSSLHPYI